MNKYLKFDREYDMYDIKKIELAKFLVTQGFDKRNIKQWFEDEEGYEESVINSFDNLEEATEAEIEDWAKTEIEFYSKENDFDMNESQINKETLRMQMLSGVITESEYKAKLQENKKKKSLKESMIGGIVGIGAINQIPPREKTDYETAFEHFLGERYETKFENREQDPYTMKEEEEVEEGKEVEEPSLYEDNPLEGGPGHMTKHRIGVISTLISDAEKDLIKYKESSFFTPELIEKMKGTIERLKSTLEDLKAQYEEEIKQIR